MAKHYFGLDKEEAATSAQPTIDTSTTSKDVEIVVTDAVAGLTRIEIANAIEKIKQRILVDDDANISYP